MSIYLRTTCSELSLLRSPHCWSPKYARLASSATATAKASNVQAQLRTSLAKKKKSKQDIIEERKNLSTQERLDEFDMIRKIERVATFDVWSQPMDLLGMYYVEFRLHNLKGSLFLRPRKIFMCPLALYRYQTSGIQSRMHGRKSEVYTLSYSQPILRYLGCEKLPRLGASPKFEEQSPTLRKYSMYNRLRGLRHSAKWHRTFIMRCKEL